MLLFLGRTGHLNLVSRSAAALATTRGRGGVGRRSTRYLALRHVSSHNSRSHANAGRTAPRALTGRARIEHGTESGLRTAQLASMMILGSTKLAHMVRLGPDHVRRNVLSVLVRIKVRLLKVGRRTNKVRNVARLGRLHGGTVVAANAQIAKSLTGAAIGASGETRCTRHLLLWSSISRVEFKRIVELTGSGDAATRDVAADGIRRAVVCGAEGLLASVHDLSLALVQVLIGYNAFLGADGIVNKGVKVQRIEQMFADRLLRSESLDDIVETISKALHMRAGLRLDLVKCLQRSIVLARDTRVEHIPASEFNPVVGVLSLQKGLDHARIVLSAAGTGHGAY